MGFLKKFFRGVFHEGAQAAMTHSSFERLSEEELEAHLGVQRYGRFTLTDAIRRDRRSVLDYGEVTVRELPDKYFDKNYMKTLD